MPTAIYSLPQLIILIYKDVVEAGLRTTQGRGSTPYTDAEGGFEAIINASTACGFYRQSPDAQLSRVHQDKSVD